MAELKDIKDKFISIVLSELSDNLYAVDTHEMGEVIDMIKDLSETMYYCSVVEAMENASDNEKDEYLTTYNANTKMKYYGNKPYLEDYPYESEHRKDLDRMARERMYFTEPEHNYKDGQAYMSRREYMEAKDIGKDTTHELEQYISDLSTDINNIYTNMTSSEKNMIKEKLANMVNKM